MTKPRSNFKITLILAVAVLLGIFVLLKWKNPAESSRGLIGTKIEPAVQLTDFQLTDADGKAFDKAQFKDQWTVVTFGFTQCPDVCPMTLGYFRDELAKLDKATQDKTQFVFVSVDPENDTPATLKKYVAAFHPDIRPVTGTTEQLKQFASIFFAHFQKKNPETAPSSLVALTHTPNFFLVDPAGNWQMMYAPPMPKGSLAADLAQVAKANSVF